jgi:hypothetical protein
METRETEVIGFVSDIDSGPSKARVAMPFKIVNAEPSLHTNSSVYLFTISYP